MSTVRAKFVCRSVSKSKHWDGTNRFLFTASLQPVTGGTDENKSFFEATPQGSIELGAFLPDAFEPGKEYYVDFTPAE
jgi:hypothetical protein